MFTVLLYYKFVNLKNPAKIKEDQLSLCRSLGLKGRIILSEEGINGTLGGSKEACDKYIEATSNYNEFKDIDWKESISEIDPFPKLRVVVRDEIVTFKAKVDMSKKADYITSEELKNLYEKNEDFVIIDGRNEYEGRIGRFKNAIVPEINHFRDFPIWFEKNKEKIIGKKVITYCTGGIRCEKLSAYLVENGVEDVKQLKGGIHTYGVEANGKDFEGTMYVFDNRIHMPINTSNPEIISECVHCGKKVARYINCCNAECNKQIICCEECDREFESACSIECKSKSRFKKNIS